MADARSGGIPAVLGEARELVDAELGLCAARLQREMPGRSGEALAYALRSPGKRVRPALVVAAYRAAGGASRAIAGVATAVEIVHTYSLVHDDLPCMDNDDLRRGRPTTHRTFDVPTATRTGYLLVPVAAETLVRAGTALGLTRERIGALAVELFEAGGIRGMVGGQWRDLEAEQRQLDMAELTAVHRGKTGALIRAAVVLGGLAAQADDAMLAALRAYGEEIGLAFQVADDVLDVTGTAEALGKPPGRDAELAKATYVSALGVVAARAAAERHCAEALARLDGAGLAGESLRALARYIVTRPS
ncbi:MAG TPA: farnesyl diphosphate synthase [Gemmatimonadales bacterium]|jgi:geranylgeranyl pyrophosphate synthase|nr:farnesyl diphosphate synthase [Gemmatimonadales bacterium]